MRLSFSTRGWWQEGWDELVSTAAEMRFNGIEIYNAGNSPEEALLAGQLFAQSMVEVLQARSK